MKIHKIQGDISSEVAQSFTDSVAIDTEATGLLIPERDKLSLVQICNEGGDVYIIQPDRTNYKMPNLASVLENEKIQKIGHFLRFDKSALEYFLKCKFVPLRKEHGRVRFQVDQDQKYEEQSYVCEMICTSTCSSSSSMQKRQHHPPSV